MIKTAADVLELIEPIDPDNFYHNGHGFYVARWLSRASVGEVSPAEQFAALRSHPLIDVVSTSQYKGIYQVTFRLKGE